jgi:hypothetical protein
LLLKSENKEILKLPKHPYFTTESPKERQEVPEMGNGKTSVTSHVTVRLFKPFPFTFPAIYLKEIKIKILFLPQ